MIKIQIITMGTSDDKLVSIRGSFTPVRWVGQDVHDRTKD